MLTKLLTILCLFRSVETGSCYAALTGLKLIYVGRPDWYQTHRDLIASASQVLGLKVCATMPGLTTVTKVNNEVSIRHLYTFIGRISIQVHPICKQVLSSFLLLSYRNSLYILDIKPLSNIWLANISPILLVILLLCLIMFLMHTWF